MAEKWQQFSITGFMKIDDEKPVGEQVAAGCAAMFTKDAADLIFMGQTLESKDGEAIKPADHVVLDGMAILIPKE